MPNTTIRNYSEEDDLEGILNLYSSTNTFFTRNMEFFRHFTNFPGVQKDGIFVALINGVVDGIAIISIAEKEDIIEGKIIELLAKNILSMDMLIKRAVEYCCNRRVDIIFLRPTMDSGMMDRVLNGWIKDDAGVIMAKPLSILPILQILLDTDLVKRFYTGKSILFVFGDETIEMRITQGSLYISHSVAEITKSDILVTMEPKTFLEIIFGSISPSVAYLTGKIRIRGIKNVFKILKLLKYLKANTCNNIALVDDV